LEQTGSLITAIERFHGRPRSLVPVSDDPADVPMLVLTDVTPIDLECPVAHAPFVEWLLPATLREPVVHAAIRGARALVGVVCTILAWHWTVGHAFLAETPLGLAIAATSICYLAGAAARVPIAALHTVSVLALGSRHGVLSAVVGATVADLVMLGLG